MTICAAPDCQHGYLAHTYRHGVGNVGRCLAPNCPCGSFEEGV